MRFFYYVVVLCVKMFFFFVYYFSVCINVNLLFLYSFCIHSEF